MSLKFIPLSGTTGVTQNCYLYEYGGDMLMVDCGVGFPEPEMFGVDLVIPDFTYVRENKNKLKGIVITHGHEDHLGALPFLLTDIDVPIYSTKLVAGFIEEKFEDHGIKKKVTVIDPEKDVVALGVFKVTPFRVSHSVPDSVGFAIDTPEGRTFHIPDYKFDWTPVDGRPFDITKLSALASQGALALASDALGATTPGYTESELYIEEIIDSIADKAKGKIFFTTISSNISRMQQAINVAIRVGRKIVFIGRSVDRKAAIAKDFGYLHYPDGLVINPNQAERLKNDQLMYIISGSYGQPGSALYRTALGEHKFVSVAKGDVVIFSSDPAPPGSKGNVDFVVDRLIELGVDVHYYDMQEDLHVSGHGSMEDIKTLFGVVKPKYFIPVGGTIRHNRAYSQIAQSMGAKAEAVFELYEGEILQFDKGSAKVAGKIPVKSVLVDGLGVGDVGNVVLRDRQTLAKDGIVIALLEVDKSTVRLLEDPELISRGFVFEAKDQGLLGEASRKVRADIERRRIPNKSAISNMAVDILEKFFFEKIGRRPMILPLVVEV